MNITLLSPTEKGVNRIMGEGYGGKITGYNVSCAGASNTFGYIGASDNNARLIVMVEN